MSGNPLVKLPKFMEIILTTFMFVLVFYVATIYNELKKIFSLTGGVMGNILSFIFPSLFYLGFTQKKMSKYGIISFFFIIFGFITMLICIASTTGLIEILGIEDII
jgi:amino acid permease